MKIKNVMKMSVAVHSDTQVGSGPLASCSVRQMSSIHFLGTLKVKGIPCGKENKQLCDWMDLKVQGSQRKS